MKLLLDSHTHTLASGHAYNTIQEMAAAAAGEGLALLAVTEHGEKMPGSCQNIYFANLRILPRRFSGIPVLFGAEANVMDYEGSLDIPERILKQLDVVIASLHVLCVAPGTREENTAALLGAVKNPFVNIIGHPDDGRYPLDYEALVTAAKEEHVLLEINVSSLLPGSIREGAWENDLAMLRLCKKIGQPVIVDTDAHFAGHLGKFGPALQLLQEADFPEELVVNTSVDQYLSYLPPIAAKRIEKDRNI